VVDHIAKKVVSAGSVPSATTNKRMVAVAVENPITERALSVTASERDAKPAPQHANEESRFVVKPRSPGRRSVHVHARPLSANQVEVRPPRPAS
jgi:hypothetical protein